MDFVQWYLENFDWLPTFFVNLEEGEKPDLLPKNIKTAERPGRDYDNGYLTGFMSYTNSFKYEYNYFFKSAINCVVIDEEQNDEDKDFVYNFTEYLERISDNKEMYDISLLDLYNNNKKLYELYFSKPRILLDDEIKYDYEIDNSHFKRSLAYNYIKNTNMKRDLYEKQINYVNNLSPLQKRVLKWYTYRGDRIMNNYLRGLFNPLNVYKQIRDVFKNEGYEEPTNFDKTLDNVVNFDTNIEFKNYIINSIEYAIEIINKIIDNAPKNTDYFIVYQYSEEQHLERKDELWENVGFYSTTLIDAFSIGPVYEARYKTYIIVPPESNFLVMIGISKFFGEFEVLFSSNNCFKLLKPFTEDTELKKLDLNIKYMGGSRTPYYKRIMLYENKGKCVT